MGDYFDLYNYKYNSLPPLYQLCLFLSSTESVYISWFLVSLSP